MDLIWQDVALVVPSADSLYGEPAAYQGVKEPSSVTVTLSRWACTHCLLTGSSAADRSPDGLG